VVAVLSLLLAFAGCSVGPTRTAAPPKAVAQVEAPPTAPASPPAEEPPPAWIANAIVPRVAVYDAPGAAAPARSLSNPTAERYPLVFGVLERQGDWVRVRLAVRPNGSTGWVRAADVTLASTPYRVVVEVGAHRVTLFNGNEQVLQDAVVVGKAQSPTPLGDSYIDVVWPLADTRGVYGPYQLSVAAFSDVLKSFGGGQGQIALHGTNAPGLLGSSVSNGCIRMRNDTITTLAQRVPAGTPVQVVA
jgi:lipoprotein-anchoring transpeptidase ErfK/SrfK